MSDSATLVPSDSFGSTTVFPETLDDPIAPMPVVRPVARYDVMEELGRGGVGQVVAATDRDIGRRVAIKRLLAEHQQSPGAMLRFVQEVRTVGQLDHPNIVTIHNVGRQPTGEYYFVMKFLEGDTLEVLLDKLRAGDPAAHAKWTFGRRTELFMQVLHAMKVAHEQGIVHRDLKPANIMVGRHGEVSVVDWGLAKRVGTPDVPIGAASGPPDPTSVVTTRMGALVGTPRYMSPEQARGAPADTRSDTWQLALVLYELVSLRHPFDGVDGIDALLEAVQTRPILPPRANPHPAQPGVPADLAWIAMDGLLRDPDQRYRDAGVMLARFERRMDGDITVQCPVTAQKAMLNRFQKTVDRRPFVLLLAFGLWLVLTGIALALGLLGLFSGAILAVFA